MSLLEEEMSLMGQNPMACRGYLQHLNNGQNLVATFCNKRPRSSPRCAKKISPLQVSNHTSQRMRKPTSTCEARN